MVVAWGCGFFARALRRLVQVPALLCCEAMVWSVTFLAFPLRMLSAVERERKLGRLIAEMQDQMDALVWENKELEERLQAALREQDAMEAVLDEMEEEHEGAFARIDALESQLKALKQENLRLIEHKGKSRWDNKQPKDDDGADKMSSRKEAAGGEEHHHQSACSDPSSYLALMTTPPPPLMGVAPAPSSDALLAAQQLEASKAVARRRSLFSLGMSLAVGAAAWSAGAPCLPLLAGLFAVVGVSTRSASRCRGGVVTLLSLNWFLLGALTSPMLPAVVPTLGPALAWVAAAAPAPAPTPL